MDLVVDANILLAALIKKSTTYDLFFIEHLHFYAPEFIFIEIEKHNEELLQKTERTEEEISKFIDILRKRIVIYPLDELVPFLKRAEEISPDPYDETYIALALKLNISIWSNDKKLKENQNIVKVYSTQDLIGLLS